MFLEKYTKYEMWTLVKRLPPIGIQVLGPIQPLLPRGAPEHGMKLGGQVTGHSAGQSAVGSKNELHKK